MLRKFDAIYAPEEASVAKALIPLTVISTYKGRDFLTHCLSTVFAQDLPDEDYEVVVVADGSSDDAVKALRGLRPPHKPVVLGLGRTFGLAAARNAGTAKATGEILLFIDDNLSCDRHFLSAHLTAPAARLHLRRTTR